MFIKPFGLAIKHKRLREKMSQRALAEAMRISATRLCKLESGKITPTRKDQAAARKVLGDLRVFSAPAFLARSLTQNARRCKPKRRQFEPSRDRPTYLRFCAAREKYPELVAALMRQLQKREDYDVCIALAYQIVAESAEEALYLLRLMAAGALPCQMAPAELAKLPITLIDPVDRSDVSFRQVACLAFESEFYFFQLTLEGPGWQYRVDALRWKDDGWSVIEIDGYGHDAAADSQREKDIGLPTVRLNVAQLSNLGHEIR